jgi:hypothetical protein
MAIQGAEPDLADTIEKRSIDAVLEVLHTARSKGDLRRVVGAYALLIDLYLDKGAGDSALATFLEAREASLADMLPRPVRMRIAAELEGRGELLFASALYGSLCRDGLVDTLALRAAVAHAEVAIRTGRVDFARALLGAARESPFATADVVANVDQVIARLDRNGGRSKSR